jgi:hypothetical protein
MVAKVNSKQVNTTGLPFLLLDTRILHNEYET